MPTIAANTRTHQLFCRDEEHRLATLALVKEVVNSTDLKNQASAGEIFFHSLLKLHGLLYTAE